MAISWIVIGSVNLAMLAGDNEGFDSNLNINIRMLYLLSAVMVNVMATVVITWFYMFTYAQISTQFALLGISIPRRFVYTYSTSLTVLILLGMATDWIRFFTNTDFYHGYQVCYNTLHFLVL